jgi:hypothetical protein
METEVFSETSVNTDPSNRRHIPKILIPIRRITLSFSNLAAPITACYSKLGTLLKSQDKFLKHKAFYSDRLRHVGTELYFQYFEVEVDFVPDNMPFASEYIL